MASQSEQDVESYVRRIKLILIGFGAVILIPVLLLIVYLDRRFDAFEDGLRYRPPDSTGDPAALIDALPWEPVQGQTVYVPAYSHVYHQDGQPHLLTVTLSVRNADPTHELVLTSVRYFNTKGQQIRSHLDKPLRVGPMASTEFLVERENASGGSGASFLVDWVAGEPVVPPVIETVMIDTSGNQGISFVRPGTVIRDHAGTPLPPREER